MRLASVSIALLALALLGGTCLPLVDTTVRTAAKENTLAVDLSSPSADTTIAQGKTVNVKWAASNVTGTPGTFSIVVEARGTLARTTLLSSVAVSGNGASGEYTWDTSDFSGAYAVYGELTNGTNSVEAKAKGIVTVDAPPTFEFTAPTADATFTPGQTPVLPVTISWKASDTNAQVKIGLDTDSDHGKFTNDPNDTSRNEIILVQRDVKTLNLTDSLSWTGKNSSGTAVAAGTYTLFAIVKDASNPDLVVESPASITVAADPNSAPSTTSITKPKSDTTFLASDPPLSIEVSAKYSTDVIIDLKVDTDDTHTNGNEITILSQRLVTANSDPFTFDWDGSGVADGIYRLVAFTSTGSGSPASVASTGLVFRRQNADVPLIALLQPASDVTVVPGNFVNVQWRDDDPKESESDPNASATIRLILDLDGSLATTDDQTEILNGRHAKGDGVQDTFNWQVPASMLTPGDTYTLFAIIDRDGVAPWDCTSAAPGRVIAKDPTKP